MFWLLTQVEYLSSCQAILFLSTATMSIYHGHVAVYNHCVVCMGSLPRYGETSATGSLKGVLPYAYPASMWFERERDTRPSKILIDPCRKSQPETGEKGGNRGNTTSPGFDGYLPLERVGNIYPR